METQDDDELGGTQKVYDVSQNTSNTRSTGEPHIQTKESNDDSVSLHLHQNTTMMNDLEETPFLNKLIDPFGESPSQQQQQQQQRQMLQITPFLNRTGSNLFGSLKRGNMFQKIRLRQQQVPMMDYESQSQMHGIVIADEDEEETQGIDDTFRFVDDDTDKRRQLVDTQIIHAMEDTQVVNDLGDTQIIPSGGGIENFEIPATQLIKRSIEVPSTAERKRRPFKPDDDVFDEIISQKSETDNEQEDGNSLNFDKSNKLTIRSDEEIENTTAMYEPVEIGTGDDVEVDESLQYQFQEDSLRVYDQLRLKKRQFSDVQLKKKPKLIRARTEFDTPSKTNSSSSSWIGNKRHRQLSSPSTEIPNSSPSMAQLAKSRTATTMGVVIESSPTTQVINTAPDIIDDVASTAPITSSSKPIEIVSSGQKSESDVQMTNVDNDLSLESSLTDLGDDVYRKQDDQLTRDDIKFYSSVWARTGDKFYPTVIKKILPDGFLIIHQGKVVNLQGYLNVFPLDIKVGDRVKIYNRKRVHCVTGLSVENDNGDEQIRCIRGFDTVYVMPLVRNTIDHVNGVEEKFNLSQIYLVNGIWMKRDFIRELDNVEYQDSLISQLPNFRGRHAKELLQLSPHKNLPPIVLNNLIESSPVSSTTTATQQTTTTTMATAVTTIFKHCCFSITSTTSESEKLNLKNLILANGGKVLENGLHEIFDESNGVSKFYSNYKFGLVLLMNGYCRSAKYLEALSLGWPVLSHLFITKCLQQDALLIDNLGSFLLPAGESNYLQTVKSCDIFKFMHNYNEGKPLSSQTSNNEILNSFQLYKLQDDSDPKRRILEFLLHCIGIAGIVNFDSLDEMVKMATEAAAHGDEDNNVLVFTNSERDRLQMVSSLQHVRLNMVDWEWVVQCIISGMVLDL